ncbi:MAG TPA: hypothetical protein VIZ28_14210 [Chitinophagaceae bacterium]
MFDFLRILIQFFDKYNIPYMLSGSMAMSTYTGPRYTRDFDFVVHLKTSDISLLRDFFNEGYYCDEDSMADAIKRKGVFNIIDHKSNYKADFIILRDDEFELVKFNRRLPVDFLDFKVSIISAEDLLLSKLVWVQNLRSALQEEDILQLSKLEHLDRTYISHWINSLKLNTFGLLKND